MSTAAADDDGWVETGPEPGDTAPTEPAEPLTVVPGIPAREAPESPATPSDEPVRTRVRTPRVRKPREPKARTVKAQTTAPTRTAEQYGAEATKAVRELAATLALGSQLVPALALDAVALSLYAEPLGQATGKVAAENAALAKVLDRIIEASAVSQLVGVIVTLGAQLAANHGALPAPMLQLGVALPPDKLVEAAQAAGVIPTPPEDEQP